jgi:hypothetical protein
MPTIKKLSTQVCGRLSYSRDEQRFSYVSITLHLYGNGKPVST